MSSTNPLVPLLNEVRLSMDHIHDIPLCRKGMASMVVAHRHLQLTLSDVAERETRLQYISG